MSSPASAESQEAATQTTDPRSPRRVRHEARRRTLTISQVEKTITDRYGKDYLVNPRVNVEVLNYRPFFILGEVKNPGSYPYVNGMTVLNAVALAGGYTPRADKSHAMIKHADDPNAAGTRVPEDATVLPGDVIRIQERFF